MVNELFKLKEIEKIGQNGEPIINQFTAQVRNGELLTIIGPSGSGKSTLLSLFNRLKDPEAGLLSFKGQPIMDYDVLDLRRNIGMVFQQPIMLKGTVKENLFLGPALQGKSIRMEEIEDLFHWMGLDLSLLNQNAIHLSGGQKQKVALARLLLNDPQVLLLDEITASLDSKSTVDIERYIKKINREKELTIIWVTHDIEQVKRISDYTWVIAGGRLIEENKTVRLFQNPTHPITKSLLNSLSEGG